MLFPAGGREVSQQKAGRPPQSFDGGGLPAFYSVLLCACVVGCALTGDAAKDHKVGHGGAAQTVCTVDAARHFTGCEQMTVPSSFSTSVALLMVTPPMVWWTPAVTLMA